MQTRIIISDPMCPVYQPAPVSPMFRQTITITITRNIKEDYYYYYYFPDYYYYYYFPITMTFIITVEPKKHDTSRLQSNIQRHLLLLLYHTLLQTHYHRYYHYKTKLKIL